MLCSHQHQFSLVLRVWTCYQKLSRVFYLEIHQRVAIYQKTTEKVLVSSESMSMVRVSQTFREFSRQREAPASQRRFTKSRIQFMLFRCLAILFFPFLLLFELCLFFGAGQSHLRSAKTILGESLQDKRLGWSLVGNPKEKMFTMFQGFATRMIRISTVDPAPKEGFIQPFSPSSTKKVPRCTNKIFWFSFKVGKKKRARALLNTRQHKFKFLIWIYTVRNWPISDLHSVLRSKSKDTIVWLFLLTILSQWFGWQRTCINKIAPNFITKDMLRNNKTFMTFNNRKKCLPRLISYA